MHTVSQAFSTLTVITSFFFFLQNSIALSQLLHLLSAKAFIELHVVKIAVFEHTVVVALLWGIVFFALQNHKYQEGLKFSAVLPLNKNQHSSHSRKDS